ncbi:uncharacterized protein [Vicugna pacos]|uniref:28S ribosomal protein S24, mitochondrial n=1 Tax=Vicugna pacos TaxID=30538 RepID=A0ABM5CSL2_VICPA
MAASARAHGRGAGDPPPRPPPPHPARRPEGLEEERRAGGDPGPLCLLMGFQKASQSGISRNFLLNFQITQAARRIPAPRPLARPRLVRPRGRIPPAAQGTCRYPASAARRARRHGPPGQEGGGAAARAARGGNLDGEEHAAERTVEDVFLRKFMLGTFPGCLADQLVLKRRANQLEICALVLRQLPAHKFYFLVGYSETLLSHFYKCPVRLHLQTVPSKVVYKYI